MAFACSAFLYPHPFRLALRLAFPCQLPEEEYGLTTFPRECPSGLGPAALPVPRRLRQMSSKHLNPGHLPFGPSLSASLACSH